MAAVPPEVQDFLQQHPFLQLTEGNKVKCTLNGHELPCRLAELRGFTGGKRYQRLSAAADFDYSQYEPHVVPSSKQPKQLFCRLTLRHINRLPHHVLRHVSGRRYQRALQKYEECQQRGEQYVPSCLKQKRPRQEGDAGRGGGFWEPNSSDRDGSDSDDSMSDLYPVEMFTMKEPLEGGTKEESEDFETDSEDKAPAPPGGQDSVAQMEVDRPATQKRKKTQGNSFKKRFKNHHRKGKGFKTGGKKKNGK
ncbi:surfeit locus protein 2 [Amia ocellicauda]|uniref:surfeit locus protein 2 n=1 Tax=Amia ocellicauda TaxID=2972642 RepID=UPI003464B0A5